MMNCGQRRPARRPTAGATRSAGCGCGWWAAPSAGRWWRARTPRASGGSSSVFNSALDAAVDSMWTSSRMYTLVRPGVPMAVLAMRSRMASTPLLEAASSSWTSNEVPCSMARHDSQTPQGSPSLAFGAVEDLGQDAGGRGLARAPGAAEQVGVAHPVAADRVAAGPAPGAPGRAPRRSAAGGSGGRATGRPSAPEPTGADPPAEQDPNERRTRSASSRRDEQNPLPRVVVRRSAAHEQVPLRAAAFRP